MSWAFSVNVLGLTNKQTNKKIVKNLCIFSNENFNVKTKCGTKEKKSVENKWTGLFLPIFSKWTGLNC